MLRNAGFAIAFVTLYLLVYTLLIQFPAGFTAGLIMLMISPFLVCWLVYTVLKYGIYTGPELGNKEFGYEDKPGE